MDEYKGKGGLCDQQFVAHNFSTWQMAVLFFIFFLFKQYFISKKWIRQQAESL